MAYKSIKKGKGKRKGGKKSNRRTYKQNGGNKMLIMVLYMLVVLGIIVPVSAKFYNEHVNKEENEKKIEVFKNRIISNDRIIHTGNRDNNMLGLAAAIFAPGAIGTVAKLAYVSSKVRPNTVTEAREQRVLDHRKLEILYAQLNDDFLYFSEKDMKKFLPRGFKKTFNEKYIELNTEPPNIYNMYDPDRIDSPIEPIHFNTNGLNKDYSIYHGYYYAFPYKKFLELVEENNQFAEVVKDLTEEVVKDLTEEIKSDI
jgi:hypothetical protein